MATSLYRRHSMAQLYEKLRAQDDDDMAWLAQYGIDDKSDEPYVPIASSPPALSTISSASPVSSRSSRPSFSDPGFGSESSDDPFDSDSDSDPDPEPVVSDPPYAELDSSWCSSLILQPDGFTDLMAIDSPYVPSKEGLQETSPLPSRFTPPVDEPDTLPSLIISSPRPALSVTSRRAARITRNSSARGCSPAVLRDLSEDAYSESDGNGSEDEYVPSPTVGSKKRRRCTGPVPVSAEASSRKRCAESPSRKRPRQSPLPRNAQAAPGMTPAAPIAKSNQWACPYCRWVQRNHRTPDLKRHIRTHTRLQRPAQWVCCGVSVKDAKRYSIPADVQPYEWEGEMMIGGCCKEFSRRDALKRHLDNEHISCIGNFAAFASIAEDDA